MASLDYLRLTSYEITYSQLLSKLLTAFPGDQKPSRWLQYKGWKINQMFIGVGEQGGRMHMVVSASGSQSQELAYFMTGQTLLNCTRIDVQRTVERPKNLRLRTVRDAVEIKNTTLIESKENDTLYLGSRESNLYTRLYEKFLDKMYLRLEFELKGDRARYAWWNLENGKTPSDVYSHYLKKSPLPENICKLFDRPDDDQGLLVADLENKATAKRRLKWLRSLDASVELAMRDHEIGTEVMYLIRAWGKVADKIDLDNNIT